jgi:lipopolysaccharide transport system permease protein
MAGGHDDRAAVAQVDDQELPLSHYRKALFAATRSCAGRARYDGRQCAAGAGGLWLQLWGGSAIAPALMTLLAQTRPDPLARNAVLELTSDMSAGIRTRMAVQDVVDGFRLFRLGAVLGWLDIRLRYRGSVLGPFWLTLSTAVMVGALGLLYSTLFKIELRSYLPFLALSLVLWNFFSALVTDGCTCFTESEAMIRSMRMPYLLYAIRVAVRNVLVLAHNIIVIVGVFAIFWMWPGKVAVLVFPALVLWAVDAIAVIVLLGAFCSRFRDIPPIVGSIMQLAFFMSPIIWKPELLASKSWTLPLNPFYSLLEIVRGPLLGEMPTKYTFASAILYSLLLCVVSWLLFVRVRGRLAFWV